MVFTPSLFSDLGQARVPSQPQAAAATGVVATTCIYGAEYLNVNIASECHREMKEDKERSDESHKADCLTLKGT